MIIRRAIGRDFDDLLALGNRMHKESVTNFPPIAEEKVALFLKASLDAPDSVAVYVAEDNGIIGMITAVLSEYSFSYTQRAVCDMLFVVPERRGAVAARKLIRKFIHWSRDIGADDAIMGISTGVNPERTGKMFERLGFELMGHSYRMGLKDV